MKNTNLEIELNDTSFERDVAEMTALFDDVFQNSALSSPLAVIEKIHHEAHTHSRGLRFKRKLRHAMRAATAVAALLLLMAGGMQINSVQQSNWRIEVINQLSIVSETELLKDDSIENSNAVLADLLMEMQGLDAETYFAFN